MIVCQQQKVLMICVKNSEIVGVFTKVLKSNLFWLKIRSLSEPKQLWGNTSAIKAVIHTDRIL